MHILTYTQKHNITKNVHTYMHTKPYMIKCIRLLAAAGRGYRQKVHTLCAYTIYTYMFTRKSVHTIYTHQRYQYRQIITFLPAEYQKYHGM